MVIAQEDKKGTDTVKQRNNSGLKPWQPGQSGNPNGRPKNPDSISACIRKILEETDSEGVTKAQLIAKKLLALALDGDRQAMDMVLDRMEGRPIQALMHGSVNETTQSLLEGLAANRNGGEDAIQGSGSKEAVQQGADEEVQGNTSG